ncbi:ATP-grasp domain-containing protein [Pyxidicoccus fallax]|uniref:ATP-grasp domain-containing protein n=1 Tax=Pyxidicoccus fallax TaxID=394095 RepID=A0A848LMR8_9BACT|nr:ATP-grasp domain-containing protein [Pyxidicoccus fallax]NMO19135.1 ATP-grasp domain-containing protein [Pyxidicoccus fallax]NPC82131.1 ATP-grasp domain-containing protein [Pyxidicoccus fallax]
MLRRAFIQEEGHGRMEPEMRDLRDALDERDVPTELFTAKRLERRQLPLARDTLVAGYVPTVLGALKQLGIEPPPTNDYPRCLEPFLHRRMWTSTVRRLTESLLELSSPPVFAKPVGRRKRFTGHVFRTADDLLLLERASMNTQLICSEAVRWLSEYRVFVVRGTIVGIRHYAGDASVRVHEDTVGEAVRLLESSGEATAGYGVDFGVLATGETALVEWNDGFSLGAYGLERGHYADLTVARWCELTGVTAATPHAS